MKDENDFMVRLPVSEIVRIVSDAEANKAVNKPGDFPRYQNGYGPIEALESLKKTWSIVINGDGIYITEGFDTQKECAKRAAYYYERNGFEIVHVLKNGIPRKNIQAKVVMSFR